MSETEVQQDRFDARLRRLDKDFFSQFPSLPPNFTRAISKELTNTLAPITIIHDLPGKPITDFSVSVDPFGTQNQSQLIMDCLQEYTTQGNPVMMGAGRYLCDDPLELISNSRMRASANATFLKNFGTFALLSQADFGTPISNMSWQGGIIEHVDPENQSSNPFSLNLIESEVAYLTIRKWGDQGRLLLFGDKNWIHGIIAINEDEDGVGGGGGLWVGRATENLCESIRLKTSDDALMWNLSAQGAYTGGLCAGNVYHNCQVHSVDARCLVSAMQRITVPPLPDMDGTIRDNVASLITGKGMMAMGFFNTLSTGPMHGMKVSQSVFDCSAYTTDQPAIDVHGDSSHGGLYDIDLSGVTVKSPSTWALRVRGISSNIRVNRGIYEAPRITQQTIEVDESAELIMEGATVYGRSDADIVQVGADGNSLARAYFRGNTFKGIANTHDAIVFTSAAGGEVEDNTFVEASGATSARAFTVSAIAFNIKVGPNDYRLTIAIKVAWAAVANSGCRWQDERVVTISANTTQRTTDSGKTYILTGAVNRTLTLTTAGDQLSVGGVQGGTGLLKMQLLGNDVIHIGAASTTAGGYIESTAKGDSVKLRSTDDVNWYAVEYTGTWTVA